MPDDKFKRILDEMVADLNDKKAAFAEAVQLQTLVGRTALKYETAVRILTSRKPRDRETALDSVDVALTMAEHLISQLEEGARHVAARKV